MVSTELLNQELTARYAAWTGLMVVNGFIFSSAFEIVAHDPSNTQIVPGLIALFGAIGVILPVIAFASISAAFRSVRRSGLGQNVGDMPDPLRVSKSCKWTIYVCETGSAVMTLSAMLALLSSVVCK